MLSILVSLIAAFVNFYLAAFMLTRDRKNEINRRFFFFILTLGVLNLRELLVNLVVTPSLALLWAKALAIGTAWLPSTFYHFALSFAPAKRRGGNISVWAAYLASFVLTGLILKGDIITNITYLYGGYSPVGSEPGRWGSIAFYLIVLIFGSYSFLKNCNSASEFESPDLPRNLTLFVGCFMAIVLNIPNTLLSVGTYFLYPSAQFSAVCSSGILGYCILKYHFANTTASSRKNLVYTLLTGLVTSMFLINLILLGKFLEGLTGLNSVIPSILIASVAAFFMQPVRNKIQNLIDKSFLRERYELQTAIRDFSRTIVSILDRQELINIIVNTLHTSMHVTRVGIYAYDRVEREYQCLNAGDRESSGGKVASRPPSLRHNQALTQWMESHRQELLYSHLGRKHLTDSGNWDYAEIGEEMRHLGAHICLPLLIENQLTGFIALDRKLSGENFTKDDIDVLSILANEVAIALENANLYKEIKDNLLNTVKALSAAVEAKDTYTSGHCERVIGYAVQMGRLMKLPQNQIESIVFGATLHDIGKIGIDEKILLKPGKLTEREFNTIKMHPITGAKILKAIKLPKEALDIVKYHHERYDGKGYPYGLKAREIPLAARIISVADAYEALTSDRIYRKAMSKQDAINVLVAESGKQFDPEIVEVFTSLIR